MNEPQLDGPVLELRYQGTVLEQYPLSPGTCLTVGREDNNPIVIPDPTVSRCHAEIFVLSTPGRDILIKDLGSTNGMRMGGRPVTRMFLEPGDVVEVGDHELVYRAVAEAH